ncbi:MAG: HDOD domain-containing protein [Gammaproteobacteria bacterium]|nr:HDOD domain-containing protein [Gammaproteobacteria bacterium]
MISIEQLMKGAGELASLPAVVLRINQAIDDPDSNATTIGRIVNEDPALTAQLLKLVNSPFYGFASRIDTVFRAIAIVGHQELRHLVLVAHALKTFNDMPNELVSMATYWRRSLSVGVIARVLASYARERDIERLFISGLLHDIGSLLIYQQLPCEASDILRRSQVEGVAIRDLEQQLLGFDHAQAGSALLDAWGLPAVLVDSVRYHLQPEKAPEAHQRAAMIVNLAYELHHLLDRATGLPEAEVIDPALFERLEIPVASLEKMLEQAQIHYEEGCSLIMS